MQLDKSGNYFSQKGYKTYRYLVHVVNLQLAVDLLIGPVLFRWMVTNVIPSSLASPDHDAFTEQITDLVLLCLAGSAP